MLSSKERKAPNLLSNDKGEIQPRQCKTQAKSLRRALTELSLPAAAQTWLLSFRFCVRHKIPHGILKTRARQSHAIFNSIFSSTCFLERSEDTNAMLRGQLFYPSFMRKEVLGTLLLRCPKCTNG